MADRGRKAFPVSSHLCDERWQRHCMDLHKQRLAEMKHRIDNTKPETFDLVLSKGKRQMLDKERQTEVDRENAILLQKMVRIKETDTRAVFRPWTARSVFQWKVGHYCDPATNTKTLDHINLTSSVSPRSIHYFALTRPGTAPPDVTARLRDMEIQVDNTKLLRAITTMKSHYDVDAMERRHMDESILVSRISNFRGPEHARYLPPNRSVSASRGSPYLAPLSHRSTSPTRQGPRVAPRTVWTSPPTQPMSQQQYYEEAQNRDIPPPTSRSNSRPGTAIGGTQEGLGETTPRHGDSRSSRPSMSSASSLSRLNGRQEDMHTATAAAGTGGRAGSAKAGTSFSFGAQEEQLGGAGASSSGQGRASSSHSHRSSGSAAAAKPQMADPMTSADDYGDEEYDQDGDPYADEAEHDHMDSGPQGGDAEEEEEEEEEEEAKAHVSGGDDYEQADGGDKSEEEEEGYGEERFDGDDEPAAQANLYTSSQAEEEDQGHAHARSTSRSRTSKSGSSMHEDEQVPAPARNASRTNSSKAASSTGGSRVASAKASGSSYGEDAPYGDDGAATQGDEDSSGARQGEEEPEASQAEDAAAGGDEQQTLAEASYGAASGGGAEEEPDEALRSELRAAEEAEMEQQFATEMAADAGPESGDGGASLGNGSQATSTSLPKPGGFAADWD